MEGGTGPQVPQQEVVPVLVNGPFQGLQVPGLKEVLGKDVPEKGWREGTRQLCHPPRPGGFRAILVLHGLAFFAWFEFFCTDEELQVVKLRQKSLIWCPPSLASPKGLHAATMDTIEDGAAPKLPQNLIAVIKHHSGHHWGQRLCSL